MSIKASQDQAVTPCPLFPSHSRAVTSQHTDTQSEGGVHSGCWLMIRIERKAEASFSAWESEVEAGNVWIGDQRPELVSYALYAGLKWTHLYT